MFTLKCSPTHRHLVSAAVSLVAACLLAGCGGKQPPAEEQIDLSKSTDIFEVPAPAPVTAPPGTTVVVVVEGTEVTVADIDKEIRGMLSRAPQQLPPERIAQMRTQLQAQVIDNLIIKNLLRKAIDDQGVTITDEEYKEGLEKLSATLPAGVTLESHLERINMTADDLRENLTIDLRINKLIMGKTEGLAEPTEEEMRELYDTNQERFNKPESVSASHILITVEETDDEQTKAAKKAKIEDIRKRLIEGADFAAVASEESDCPSKVRGGDLGEFVKGQMVPAFEEAAFSQEAGAIGEVVETRFGYHIIKVQERNDAHLVPFEEAKEQIARVLTMQGRQKVVRDFIEELKANGSIQFNEEVAQPRMPARSMEPAADEPAPEPAPAE